MDMKAWGGKECWGPPGAKWAQLGQRYKAAAEKLNPNPKSEKRKPPKDRGQR